MDTENLKVFIQIVGTGSIQGAARALGVSRSSLRRSLDALEAEVGAPLLHRDPTGVRLTPAGVVAIELGRAIVESARGLVANARAAEREVWGTIRVIEPVGLPLTLHVNAILAAHMALPRQRLVIRHVENPLSDLGEPFELMLHEGPAPDRNAWFSCVILRVNLRLMASREYLQRRGMPGSVAELAEHETLGWIRPAHPPELWSLLAGGSIRDRAQRRRRHRAGLPRHHALSAPGRRPHARDPGADTRLARGAAQGLIAARGWPEFGQAGESHRRSGGMVGDRTIPWPDFDQRPW